jgi:hypothetical protein
VSEFEEAGWPVRLAARANIRLSFAPAPSCPLLQQFKTPTYKNALPTTINPKQLIPPRINVHTLSYVSYPNCKNVESIYAKRDRAGTPKIYRLPVSRGCSRISSSTKSTTPHFGV